MSARRIVVTGANRGIGLELARSFSELGHDVWGTAREPEAATELANSGVAGVLPLDVADASSISGFASALANVTDGVDVLINNAGVGAASFGVARDSAGMDEVDPDLIRRVLDVNSIGPLLVTRSLLPLLHAGASPIVCNISSQLGSMVVGKDLGDIAYNVSKAALNMITVKSANAYPAVTFVAMHPGWVQTDMGGDQADLTPQESASAIADTVSGLTLDDSGRFLNWDGTTHPW